EWGRFTAPKMVCHLADSLKMAMGDLKVVPKHLPIRYPPLKQLIIYVAPFPKGAPTAPELLAREPREWANDVADVQDLLARAAPASFASFSGDGSDRTAARILAHIGDLYDWALTQAQGAEAWRDSTPLEWEREVDRFFAALQRFDAYLASDAPLAAPPETLF